MIPERGVDPGFGRWIVSAIPLAGEKRRSIVFAPPK